jgi:hypothetical protein
MSRQQNQLILTTQVSTISEEERLGLDFSQLFAQRQKPAVEATVEPFMVPREGTKELTFTSEYATGCAAGLPCP